MGDGIHLPYLTQKPVAQPFALMGTLDQTRNIDEFDGCRRCLLRFDEAREIRETFIGNRDDPQVRFDGAERVRLGRDGQGGEGVEYRRFARVRKTDYATGKTQDSPPVNQSEDRRSTD
jgi:hypothetical protein